MTMRVSLACALGFGLVLMVAGCGGGGGGNQPPLLTSNLPAALEERAGWEMVFSVTATDPDGDPVDLVLLNPPAQDEFQPILAAPGSGTSEVRWFAGLFDIGTREFVFRLSDDQGNVAVRPFSVDVNPAGFGDFAKVEDVPGDGVLDLVIAAPDADVSGVQNAGAVYVRDGAGPWIATPAPAVVLEVPGDQSGDRLGYAQCHPLMICDVTGDGLLEIVGIASLADRIAADTGAAYVWRVGTPTGHLPPWATLSVPTAVAGDQLAGRRFPP